MRVFLDTNVLASSLATRGLCSELLEAVVHEHELVTCQPVLDELERVLSEKLRLPKLVVAGFVRLLHAESEIVQSRSEPALRLRNPDDVVVLVYATGAKAHVFVAGDKELLELDRVSDIPIISPREFWLQLAGLEDRGARK